MTGRRWRRAPYPGILVSPSPEVMLDFTTGMGIRVENGGSGGRGSELVQITSPQDTGNNARLVRAPRYWDPAVHWRTGEPIFIPKQAGRLVGWPGPRMVGYWTGPMPSVSSTTETVAVYSSTTGRTVTTVAGGVIGPQAIRCDVAAGYNGDGWAAVPYPVMTSGWSHYEDGHRTGCYVHAVVELLGAIGNHRFRFGLYDNGAGQFVEQITQRYDQADQQRAGKIYRGIGPHGGHLYEIWAIARLISNPVGPLHALAYLLSSGSGSNPARTVIVHGVQIYFFAEWRTWPLAGILPFFSHARGTSVVWTAEDVRINDVTAAYTVGVNLRTPAFDAGLVMQYGAFVARNNAINERLVHLTLYQLHGYAPSFFLGGFSGRAVVRVDADYARHATVDGTTIVDCGSFNSPAWNPSYLTVGMAAGPWYGRMRRLLLWRRALTDAEMRRAFDQLGEPVL